MASAWKDTAKKQAVATIMKILFNSKFLFIDHF